MNKLLLGNVLTAALAAAAAGCAAPADDSSATDDALTSSCGAEDLPPLADLAGAAEDCDAIAFNPTPMPRAKGFQHFSSTLIAKQTANHRGRDSIFAVDEEQWVLGKFAYGLSDKDIHDELVDIYVLRGCAAKAWEKIGTTTTTLDKKPHETVEGVEDTGGRIYFNIPADKRLPMGRHRIRMVVRGDGSYAEEFIEVLPKGTKFFVSDVDGTLTERKSNDKKIVCDEESDLPAAWNDFTKGAGQPTLHEGAADAFRQLVDRGYRPLYLTARPEWLAPHTRRFLKAKNRNDGRGDERGDLPQGTVHTTLTLTGLFNKPAEEFKSNEIARLKAKGFVVAFGFGNRPSDVATYDGARIPYKYFYENQSTDARDCSKILDIDALPEDASEVAAHKYRITSYKSLLPLFDNLGPACK